MKLAPILLFTYNRPKHTKEALEALKDNYLASESDLYIFSDSHKNYDNKEKVEQVRKIIDNIKGFRSIKIIKQEKNLGLATSIINGITNICNEYDRFIVLEDDIKTFPYFLTFMNEGLEFYKDKPYVMQINGYFFQHNEILPETFFYNHALCWGWASWKRSWDFLVKNEDYKDINKLINNIKNKKDLNSKMYLKNALSQLYANKNGEINTWATRWQAIITGNNGVCLTPKYSLTQNIGNDNSGENSKFTSIFSVQDYNKKIYIDKIVQDESIEAIKISNRVLKRFRGSLFKRFIRKIKNISTLINKSKIK